MGADPTGPGTDGRPKYTLPVIYDDKTARFISDSAVIAEYLEDTYPDTPSLFPFGARAPVFLLQAYLTSSAMKPFFLITIQDAVHVLNPTSAEFYRRTREEFFMKKLDDLVPEAERKERFAAGKDGMSKLAELLSKNGEDSLYFYGSTASYADLIVISYLMYARAILGDRWKPMEEWDGGRWKRLLDATKEYQILEQ